MHMQLTDHELKQLYVFCHKHYVYQYDLQTELVDHLASSIEEQWETNPELNFDEALKNCWSKFGIFGFSKVKQQKEKELRRKYNYLLWNYFLKFYKLPKIILTFALTLLFYSALKYTNYDVEIISAYCMIMVVSLILYYYFYYPRYIKIKTIPGKSFLLLKILQDVQVTATFVVQLPIFFFNINNAYELNLINNSYILFGISLVTISFTILMYGNLFFLPKKIKEHFMESYAEFAV